MAQKLVDLIISLGDTADMADRLVAVGQLSVVEDVLLSLPGLFEQFFVELGVDAVVANDFAAAKQALILRNTSLRLKLEAIPVGQALVYLDSLSSLCHEVSRRYAAVALQHSLSYPNDFSPVDLFSAN
ncbi:MAG: hypothetical protein JKY70_18895 [Mucilaginibacter sp.]|nr:hypothetical protein [Mucilaginibacter sp.]